MKCQEDVTIATRKRLETSRGFTVRSGSYLKALNRPDFFYI